MTKSNIKLLLVILAVAALVGPLCGIVAVLGEVQVVHIELVEVCLKQTFYAPMV